MCLISVFKLFEMKYNMETLSDNIFLFCKVKSEDELLFNAIDCACRGHEESVLCVRFDSTRIVSSSCDKSIKVRIQRKT